MNVSKVIPSSLGCGLNPQPSLPLAVPGRCLARDGKPGPALAERERPPPHRTLYHHQVPKHDLATADEEIEALKQSLSEARDRYSLCLPWVDCPDCFLVDMLDLRFTSVNVGGGKSPDSKIWWDQTDLESASRLRVCQRRPGRHYLRPMTGTLIPEPHTLNLKL